MKSNLSYFDPKTLDKLRDRSIYEDLIPEGPDFPTVNDALRICRFCMSGLYTAETTPAVVRKETRDPETGKIIKEGQVASNALAVASTMTPHEVSTIRMNPMRAVTMARAIMDEATNAWTWNKRRHELFRRLDTRL